MLIRFLKNHETSNNFVIPKGSKYLLEWSESNKERLHMHPYQGSYSPANARFYVPCSMFVDFIKKGIFEVLNEKDL